MKIKYSCKIREPGQFFVGDLVVPNNRTTERYFGKDPLLVEEIIFRSEWNVKAQSNITVTRLKLRGTQLEPATSVFNLFKPKS